MTRYVSALFACAVLTAVLSTQASKWRTSSGAELVDSDSSPRATLAVKSNHHH